MSIFTAVGFVIASFLCGLVVGLTLRLPKPSQSDKSAPILVKRTRASFRHPGRTSITEYEEYKTTNGLYAPVRPGKGSMANEKEVK